MTIRLHDTSSAHSNKLSVRWNERYLPSLRTAQAELGPSSESSRSPTRGSSASVAFSSKTLASNSSSSDSQRRSHTRASSRLGAPNQSRSSTRLNQVQILSN